MRLMVKLFATLKTRAQAGQVAVELESEEPCVGDLLAGIRTQHPLLESSLSSVLVAVNREYAFAEQVLKTGDEIALFPPVSGG